MKDLLDLYQLKATQACLSQQRAQIPKAHREMAVQHQLSPPTADHQIQVKAAAEKIAATADVGRSIKIEVAAGTEITTAVVATEMAAAGSDNKVAVVETNKVVAATIDQAAHANAAGRDLTIHHRWKSRWKQSRRSLMKN